MGQEVKISAPPVFDLDKAILAKETTEKEGYSFVPVVRTAGNLWLYNSPVEAWPAVLRKLHALKLREDEAARVDNPLPTIGWEVESPSKPFNPSLSGRYAIFFDLMGFPRNKINTRVVPGNSTSYTYMWEFSTAPAYSSAVANRTLCELIRGGFIPYLEGPATPMDRFELLDQKLVSMHINIGIPDWAGEIQTSGDKNPDILVMASAFELAYTSPERFLHRHQKSSIVGLKDAEPTSKFNQIGKRLELKAFEVSDRRTYRLMEEIQLVASAAFCAIAKKDALPESIWERTRDKINTVYKYYSVCPSVVAQHEVVVDLLRRFKIQRKLRRVLTESAHQVRLALRLSFT